MPDETQQQDQQAQPENEPQTTPERQVPTEGETQIPEEQAPTEGETQVPEQQALPEIGVTTEDAGTLKKKLTVTVPRQRIEAKQDEMFGELHKTAHVPGFRVGRAPRRLLEKRFGREVSQDVRNALVGESIGSAIEKAGLRTLGQPDLDLEKIEMPESGDMQFSFEVEVAPEFEMPELKGIQVKKPFIAVGEERIDQYMDQLRQREATFHAADEPAEAGDVVVVDARISGEGLTEVERSDLELRVAPGQVEGLPLVDLGTALTGKKAGDSAALTVKVPQAHPNVDWREKDLTVDLAVTQVRRRRLPELSDEFARSSGFDSLQDMRNYIRSRLESRLAAETQRSLRDQVCQYLLDNTKFDLPEGVAARHTMQVLQRRYISLLEMGVPRERIDENLTELQTTAAEQANRDLKLSFILAKVAEAEDIEVDEDEVNARIAQMAREYNRRPERLRQELSADGAIEQVEVAVREEKALDKLLEQAQVTETSAQEPAGGGAEPSAQEPAEGGAEPSAQEPQGQDKPGQPE